MNDWIKTEDRLPELIAYDHLLEKISAVCILYVPDVPEIFQIDVGVYYSYTDASMSGWFTVSGERIPTYRVSHWMPIEPPEKEGWIKTEDRLPERIGRDTLLRNPLLNEISAVCILYVPDVPEICKIDVGDYHWFADPSGNGWFTVGGERIPTYWVSHWMPIKPPGEEKNEA